MNISPFQVLSPTTFSTGVPTFLKKLHSRRRAVISHLHCTGEEAVAQRGEVTSLRSHSTLLSGAGQEPRAPNSHPSECYVASHRPASRLDMAELRGWAPCGHNPASLLGHHLLSEAEGWHLRVWHRGPYHPEEIGITVAATASFPAPLSQQECRAEEGTALNRSFSTLPG